MNKALAIQHLFPNAKNGTDFEVHDDGEGQYIKFWNLPDPQPTDAELEAAYAGYEAAQAAVAYKGQRQREYASLQDQMDMLYWDRKNGTTTFVDHRDTVKAKHPKPR